MTLECCPLCDGPLSGSKIPALLQCTQCNFVRADVNMSAAELAGLYNHDYYHGQEYGNYTQDENVLKRGFRQRLGPLCKLLPNPDQASLLDIGCAYGFFLEVAQTELGQVMGIDVSEDAVRRAKERLDVPIVCGDFLEEAIDQPLDVCCMWETIAHLADPKRYIAAIHERLKPGGLLAISTCDIGSLNARFRGRRWRAIHPPTHINYFSSTTLRVLLERNGFEIVHQRHVGNWRSLDNMLYIILSLRMKRPGWYQLAKRLGVTRGALYMNLYDMVYMIGRKQS